MGYLTLNRSAARLATGAIFFIFLFVMLGCNGEGSTSIPSSELDGGPTLPDGGLGPIVNITLATYNLHDFFDEADDPATSDDTNLTTADVETHMNKIAADLLAIKADVIALQEVENKALLERLNREKLAALNYQYLSLLPGKDLRGINVALLSRFPIVVERSHASEYFPSVTGENRNYGFSRDCLEIHLQVAAGRKLILLINHLAAKDDATADNRRYAQANHVRELADALLRTETNANLAVVGDLNDTPDSQTLDELMNGTPVFSNILESVSNNERYTYTYNGTKQLIDYILSSPGLTQDLEAGSPRILHYMQSSDHSPALAKFNLQ